MGSVKGLLIWGPLQVVPRMFCVVCLACPQLQGDGGQNLVFVSSYLNFQAKICVFGCEVSIPRSHLLYEGIITFGFKIWFH